MSSTINKPNADTETDISRAQPGERSLIAGMMQVYLRDLSVHTGQRAAGNGRFQYPYLDAYWSAPDRHAFLIRSNRNVVGFALVREIPGGTTMAEFFIKPEFRRQGHGRIAAQAIFRMFPGKWAVRQQITNSDGQAFWRRVIKGVDNHYSERIETTRDGHSGTVQRFLVSE
jgi:predicted acetyltransferase